MSIFDEKIPVRKSLRLNADFISLDSTPIQCSRPKLNINAFTPSPVPKDPEDGPKSKFIVVDSSKKKDSGLCPSESLKRKGKEKVDLPHDSDFEDEIPIFKRFHFKPETKSANATCKYENVSRENAENLKGFKSKKSRGKNLKATPKLLPSVWSVFTGKGDEYKKEALVLAVQHLELIEEQLKEKKFFGGEKNIGYVDLVLGWMAYLVDVFEEVINMKLFDAAKFPLLSGWMKNFHDDPAIKRHLLPRDKLVTKYQLLHEKDQTAN